MHTNVNHTLSLSYSHHRISQDCLDARKYLNTQLRQQKMRSYLEIYYRLDSVYVYYGDLTKHGMP